MWLLSTLFSFEALFVLFLFAGRFKADPRFAVIPVDITALLLVLSMLAGVWVLARRRFLVEADAWQQWLLALAFFAWVLASWYWSPGSEYATQKAVIAFVINLWAMAAAGWIISSDPVRLVRFLTAIVLFACWVAVETVLLLRNGGAVAFVTAFGGDYLGIGSVLSFAAIVLFSFVMTGRRPWWQIMTAMALCISFIAMMFPVGGRGPIIATVAAMFTGVGWVAVRRRRLFKVSARGKSLVVLGIVAVVVLVVRMVESGEYALAAQRFMVLAESGMGDSAGVRWYYYTSTLGIISEHPWIGVGVGGWPVAMGLGFGRDYPHNLFLEVFAEQGMLGVVVLLTLLVHAAWLAVRRNGAMSTPQGFAAILLVVSAFISAMFSGDIGDNRVLFCLLGLCAASTDVWAQGMPTGRGATGPSEPPRKNGRSRVD
ncbi:MAG: O-antigen ligase family protein [Steroidobacteraceae bacterium]|nr:O-antigen ligase family protein [Steroidobacteraceae bacterium]MBP7013270.1 O-antigen ligase family protein [Steroidobacteraceae bacterium]